MLVSCVMKKPVLSETLPALNTIGLARALSLFEGLEIISNHSRFSADTQIEAEPLLSFVAGRTDKIVMHLLARGYVMENTEHEPEEIAAQEAEHEFDDHLSFEEETGPTEAELELMRDEEEN